MGQLDTHENNIIIIYLCMLLIFRGEIRLIHDNDTKKYSLLQCSVIVYELVPGSVYFLGFAKIPAIQLLEDSLSNE